jgi:hypothetical protein
MRPGKDDGRGLAEDRCGNIRQVPGWKFRLGTLENDNIAYFDSR